jgi:hypothetical protein
VLRESVMNSSIPRFPHSLRHQIESNTLEQLHRRSDSRLCVQLPPAQRCVHGCVRLVLLVARNRHLTSSRATGLGLSRQHNAQPRCAFRTTTSVGARGAPEAASFMREHSVSERLSFSTLQLLHSIYLSRAFLLHLPRDATRTHIQYVSQRQHEQEASQ